MKTLSVEETAKKQQNNDKNKSNKKMPFSVVEAYKNLRVHLVSILEKTNSNVLAISSANVGEGKSTTSVNVAIILSQLEKKVLIVDADSRRGTVHKKMKIENEKGCTDILKGEIELKDAIMHYSDNLDVITSGSAVTNATELFCSGEFEKMISEIRSMYDYIIVDTPPINIITDALLISQKCDGILLVVRSGVTAYDDFKTMYNNIEQLQINLFGVVINGDGVESTNYYVKYGKYGRRKYGYYNGYYGYKKGKGSYYNTYYK